MVELPSIYAQNLNQEEVLNEIERRIEKDDLAEKIVKLRVEHIPKYIYNSLDFRKIAELKSRAFYFDLKFEKIDEKGERQETKTSIGKLNVEYEQFLNQIPVENLNKDKLLELGLKYLSTQTSADD